MTANASSPPLGNGQSTDGDPILYDAPGSGQGPWELVEILWGGKWLILGLAFLAAGSAYLYWRNQPKRYRASTVLLLDEKEKQLEQLGFSLPVDRTNQASREIYFLRHSQAFARRVAHRLVEKIDSTKGAPHTLLRDSLGHPASPSLIAGRLRSHVQVHRGKRELPALKISVTGTDPSAVALVANTYAQSYLDYLRESSSARLRTSLRFLEEQKQELKQRLRAVEDSIAAYVRRQGRGGLLAGGDSTGGGLVGEARQIAGEISDLRARKEKVELQLRIEEAMLDSTRARMKRIRPNLSERASSRTADRLRQTQKEIAKIQSRLQAIQVENDQLGPSLRAEVKRMKARLRTLRKKARRLADAYVQEALAAGAVNPLSEGGKGLSAIVDLRRQITEHRINMTKLKARRNALADRIAERRKALRKAPDRTLARLKRRKATTKELYVALSKSLQKTRVAAESTPDQAQVLRRAQPNLRPIGPNVRRNVLLALFLGGLMGTGLVFLFDRIDNRVEQPDDLERQGVGFFGAIPKWPSSRSVNGTSTPSEQSSTSSPAVPQWTGVAASFSPAAESYRHIATNLRLGVPTPVTVLLVTSPVSGEGKTTLAANLGVALSEAGRDVLLLDADLHGANLHRKLDCERTPGLSDWLIRQTEAIRMLRPSEEESRSVSAHEKGDRHLEEEQEYMGKLGLLPAGTEVPQPSLLLQEEHMQAPLQELQAEWDLLVLDTPPALSHDAASRLAALSDGAILIAQANETQKSVYAEALDRIDPFCSGPVAGVLNQYDASGDGVYGYGYSTYSSTYGEERTRTERMLGRMKRELRRLATGK